VHIEGENHKAEELPSPDPLFYCSWPNRIVFQDRSDKLPTSLHRKMYVKDNVSGCSLNK